VMKRTTLLEITSMAHQEEDKTKKKEREKEMKVNKSKEEAKLHHLNIPLWGW
jgi:hypothetical protein